MSLTQRFILLVFGYFQRNSEICFPHHHPSIRALFDAAVEETYRRFRTQVVSLEEFREKYVKQNPKVNDFWLENIKDTSRDPKELNDDISFKLGQKYTLSPHENEVFSENNADDRKENKELYHK